MKNKVGIKQQIQQATTSVMVNTLLLEAKGYKQMTPATLRKCERAAKARLAVVS